MQSVTLAFHGFNMEFNMEDADSVFAGFGTGPGYNSFQIVWKHAFEGDYRRLIQRSVIRVGDNSLR